MNVTIQNMTSAEAIALAAKTGQNYLLFRNSLNGNIGIVSPTGVLGHLTVGGVAVQVTAGE